MSTLRKLAKTGRTTRMLEHAKKLAREGRTVYVIADNTRDMHQMEITCGEPKLGIKFMSVTSVPGYFDWERMRAVGMKEGAIVLVDHHAIEDKFSKVLEMLHAYDSPTPRTYFKFLANGKTADGNTVSAEGHVSVDMALVESNDMPPQEAFDRCAEFLEKEFPTVKFLEGETTLKRLKKKPK